MCKIFGYSRLQTAIQTYHTGNQLFQNLLHGSRPDHEHTLQIWRASWLSDHVLTEHISLLGHLHKWDMSHSCVTDTSISRKNTCMSPDLSPGDVIALTHQKEKFFVIIAPCCILLTQGPGTFIPL